MPIAFTDDDLARADEVLNTLHKRAFLGRLSHQGHVPQGNSRQAVEKEACALLDLGVDLLNPEPSDPLLKAAGADKEDLDYGQGPYARIKAAYDAQQGRVAPGFEKLASSRVSAPLPPSGPDLPELPQVMLDSSYKVAWELAQDPEVYRAAVVKRAAWERLAEQYAAAQNSQQAA